MSGRFLSFLLVLIVITIIFLSSMILIVDIPVSRISSQTYNQLLNSMISRRWRIPWIRTGAKAHACFSVSFLCWCLQPLRRTLYIFVYLPTARRRSLRFGIYRFLFSGLLFGRFSLYRFDLLFGIYNIFWRAVEKEKTTYDRHLLGVACFEHIVISLGELNATLRFGTWIF